MIRDSRINRIEKSPVYGIYRWCSNGSNEKEIAVQRLESSKTSWTDERMKYTKYTLIETSENGPVKAVFHLEDHPEMSVVTIQLLFYLGISIQVQDWRNKIEA